MNDRPYRSDRHLRIASDQTSDSGAWKQPSPRSFAACQSGPCAKGTKICPSPEACLRAERAAAANSVLWIVVLVAAIGVAILGGSYLAGALR